MSAKFTKLRAEIETLTQRLVEAKLYDHLTSLGRIEALALDLFNNGDEAHLQKLSEPIVPS